MFPPFDESKAKKILTKVLNLLEQEKLFLSQVTKESEERKNSAVMLGALVCADENGNEINLVANSGISKQLKFEKKINTETSIEDSGIAKQLKFSKDENAVECPETAKQFGFEKKAKIMDCFARTLSAARNDEIGTNCDDEFLKVCNDENFNDDSENSKRFEETENDEIGDFEKNEGDSEDFDFVIVPPVVSAEKVSEALSKNDAEIHRLTSLRKNAKMMDCFAQTLSVARNDKNGTDCDEGEKINAHGDRDSTDYNDGVSFARDCGSKKNQSYIEEINEKLRGLCNESLEKVESLYDFACADGKIRNLKDICRARLNGKFPPTGTGDCTAPKLLNYAFSHGLTPVSLAETIFRQNGKTERACGKIGNDELQGEKEETQIQNSENEAKKTESWGMDCFARTLSEARNDGGFFTRDEKVLTVRNDDFSTACNDEKIELVSPCDTRCKIILPEILGLEILYRDDEIVVVNKQSGLLSVPGRGPEKFDSVETRLRRLFPNCIKQPAVHRLDMETSGLMILALTKEAHRKMNQEFENREVKKEYTALLDGILAKKGFQNEGEMELYFRLDVENRPHQIWDRENGKKAVTQWKILDVERYRAPDGTTRNATRVLFIPHTGRTHQLRLASSNIHGFGTPIIGDTLYGKCEKGERLLLHASKIEFTHPETGEKMILESKAPF